MLSKVQKVAEIFKTFKREYVDKFTEAMCKAVVANERKLAEMADEDTGIGKVDDKVVKNYFGTRFFL